MMNLRIISLLIAGFFCFNAQKALAQQNRVFSGETARYPEEVTAYIQKNVNAESEAVLNNFLKAWTVDSLFNLQEQERIVAVSMNMIRKNAKPHPHFTHYLNLLLTMRQKGSLTGNFEGWEKALDMLLAEKRKVVE